MPPVIAVVAGYVAEGITEAESIITGLASYALGTTWGTIAVMPGRDLVISGIVEKAKESQQK